MPRKTYRDLLRILPLMNRRRVSVNGARYGRAFSLVSASLTIVNGSFFITWVASLYSYTILHERSKQSQVTSVVCAAVLEKFFSPGPVR